MDFEWHTTASRNKAAFPAALIDTWRINTSKYEIRADTRYYVLGEGIPYQLVNSGKTLVHSGTRYSRLFGTLTEVAGVWQLEGDPREEWNLRSDGSYTYHWPGFEYFGEYTFTDTTMNTSEMRAVLSEFAGTLTFDPPYAPSVAGLWAIAGDKLTISFPSGDVVYTRV